MLLGRVQDQHRLAEERVGAGIAENVAERLIGKPDQAVLDDADALDRALGERPVASLAVAEGLLGPSSVADVADDDEGLPPGRLERHQPRLERAVDASDSRRVFQSGGRTRQRGGRERLPQAGACAVLEHLVDELSDTGLEQHVGHRLTARPSTPGSFRLRPPRRVEVGERLEDRGELGLDLDQLRRHVSQQDEIKGLHGRLGEEGHWVGRTPMLTIGASPTGWPGLEGFPAAFGCCDHEGLVADRQPAPRDPQVRGL